MKDTVDKLIDELVDGGSNFAASLGISRVAGQLYVLLFLSQRPLSLDEMMEKLKISKGYVSTNIRALERWQAVRKVWIKGSRKDFYEANPDTINIVVNQLEHGLRQRFEELEKVITKAKENIEYMRRGCSSEIRREVENLENKLKQIEMMKKKADVLIRKLDIISCF